MRLALIYLVSAIILWLVGLHHFVVWHETVHYKIYRYYGCNATIEVGLFGGKTIPNCSSVNQDMLLAHSVNEAIGYHIRFLYETFGIMFILTGFFVMALLENASCKAFKYR